LGLAFEIGVYAKPVIPAKASNPNCWCTGTEFLKYMDLSLCSGFSKCLKPVRVDCAYRFQVYVKRRMELKPSMGPTSRRWDSKGQLISTNGPRTSPIRFKMRLKCLPDPVAGCVLNVRVNDQLVSPRLPNFAWGDDSLPFVATGCHQAVHGIASAIAHSQRGFHA
jgi:hypothetical protein